MRCLLCSFLSAVALLLVVAPALRAEDAENFACTAITSGKICGACGMFKSMQAFQDMTKVEGGEYFIARFFQAETARLGLAPEGYIDACDRACGLYQLSAEATCENSH